MINYLLLSVFLSVTSFIYSQPFNAQWIAANKESKTIPNTWYCFRKSIDIKEHSAIMLAKIATDTKYWLWVNGKLLVYDGGLKRGPNPKDTYYDEVDLSPHVKKGKNIIAVLVWFWGGKGFSHNNSERTGLFFECISNGVKIVSDRSWKAIKYDAYKPSQASKPNFRLSEPNIFFDAREKMNNWNSVSYNDLAWHDAIEIGKPPVAPWNNLVKRNIPLFKFDQLKKYPKTRIAGDTLICTLPFNGQFSPYLKLRAKPGQRVFMATDTYFLGAYPGDSLYTLCSEYITTNGIQEYESLLWLSGHEMRYVIPKGVEVLSLLYRETGYSADFAGSFQCDDPFLDKLWSKSQRTLYVNMRDNYMDCPDRERAQWAGDAAMEMAEAFYSLDRRSDQLSRKLFLDLANWQTSDSIIYNPVPESDWKKELPAHSLMPLSEIWTYFIYTRDTATVKYVYPAIKKYLALWTIQTNGQLLYRKGGWDWGDWGDDIDFVLIQHGWYLKTLQTAANIALLTGKQEDYTLYNRQIGQLTEFLNGPDCWTGTEYRHKEYKKNTDDRANALMVMAGVADSTRWPAMINVFKTREHASPWMEKFVLESLIKMNEPALALTRMKKRFRQMVESRYSTLWEFWEHNEGEVHGNSGYNHGWAGGPLVLLSRYFAGIAPDEKIRDRYIIQPVLSGLKFIRASMATSKGLLKMAFEIQTRYLKFTVDIPKGLTVLIGLPKQGIGIKKISCNGADIRNLETVKLKGEDEKYYWVEARGGQYVFSMK